MYVRLSQTKRLDNYFIDLISYSFACLRPEFHLDLPKHVLVASFTSYIVYVFICVLHETNSVFVDCVVRQVHAQIIQVRGHRALVLHRGEPGQSIFVYVDTKRRDTVDKNVNPEIELEAIDQKRFMHVFLYNHVFNDASLCFQNCLLSS